MSQRYKIYYNGNSIYEPGNSWLQVIDPVLSLEVSAAGSLEMTVPPGNSYAGQISETGEVRVTDSTENGRTIWSGRVTECEIDMYGRRHIYAEGALAWLQDSLQLEGETYTGTIKSILQALISEHNSQVVETNRKFATTVTVTGMPTGTYTRDTDDANTLDEIRAFFVEPLGGYLLITYSSSSQTERPTLSYIGSFTTQCGQSIELGKNLLDYMRRTSTADIITAVIPRGKDGLQGDPVYSSAVDTYGYRYKILTFSDVDDPDELETLAREYLSSGQWAEAQYEISAADLHGIQDVDPIQLGDLVHVTSSYHGIDTWLPVTAMQIRLDSAAQQITLGTLERQELTAYHRQEREEMETDIEETATEAAQQAITDAGLSPLPAGGTAGQALVKASATDRDVTWQTVSGLPAGGTAGQVLTKNSATDGDAGWQDGGGGGGNIVFVLESAFDRATSYPEGTLVVVLDG